METIRWAMLAFALVLSCFGAVTGAMVHNWMTVCIGMAGVLFVLGAVWAEVHR